VITPRRTLDIRPAWLECGNRGDTLHVSPAEGRVYFMEAGRRETVWLFTAPPALPETLDEARAAVAEYRAR
jgi:hypothetical protein